MAHPTIPQQLQAQRDFFATGATRSVSARILLLRRLYDSIVRHEQDICAALAADLGKSPTESYMTEVGMTLRELSGLIKGTRKWALPRRKGAILPNFPGSGRIIPEPYGTVLVLSPWNYPFMLAMEPLAGAVAAGNTVIVKPSRQAPATAKVIAQILGECCPPQWVLCVNGGHDVSDELLEQRFDYIFFTGSPRIGQQVMEKAAKHLTPVTLELGGKSPVIIDDSANLKLAARRLVFGKLLNCGQTCVAPDYVLIDRRVEEAFLEQCRIALEQQYGSADQAPDHWGRIVGPKQFARLRGLIDPNKVYWGGSFREDTLQITPTILRGVTAADPIMQEEIFGPILPVLTVENMVEAEEFVTAREKPLALYLFSERKAVQKRFMEHVSFGGGCVNDTIMHLAEDLPFGGVGRSGMGSYHGKYSFDTFSREKSVLMKGTWLDLPVRYAPYKGWQEKLLHLFLR